MQADLKGYQSTTSGRGEGSSSTENGSEINYPKSLFLIRPLFLSHPLNPIAPGAQASVQAPEGLDLNAWIDAEEEKIASGVTTESTKVKKKKSKKDKGKEKAGKENGKSSSRVLEPSLSDTERAKLKAERLERQRDDPYYITEESSKSKTEFDIDEIPVVRLDVPLPEGQSIFWFSLSGSGLRTFPGRRPHSLSSSSASLFSYREPTAVTHALLYH